MADETGWLVERDMGGPHWWGRHTPTLEDDDAFGWTNDSLRAIRFARKEDAEMYIEEVGWNDVVATEHMWCEAPTLSTPEQLAETSKFMADNGL